MNKNMLFLNAILFILIVIAGCTPIVTQPNVKSTITPNFNNDKYKSVAVYVNDNENDRYRHIEEEFIKAMISKGYDIPARSDLSSIIKEQDFQNSNISDSSAAKLGKLIDVHAIVIVSVNFIERYDSVKRRVVKESEISARMIDVENGEILWIGKSTSGPYRFVKARYLAKSMPPSESPLLEVKADKEWDLNVHGKYEKSFNWKEIDKIIIQIKGLENDKSTNHLAENEIITKLMENGYRVPTRSDLNAIFKEHDFNANMLSDKALSQIGKLTNTKALMVVWTGRIDKFDSYENEDSRGRRYTVYKYGIPSSVRIVDLENSKVVWSGTFFFAEWGSKEWEESEFYQKFITGLVSSGLIPKKGSYQEGSPQ